MIAAVISSLVKGRATERTAGPQDVVSADSSKIRGIAASVRRAISVGMAGSFSVARKIASAGSGPPELIASPAVSNIFGAEPLNR